MTSSLLPFVFSPLTCSFLCGPGFPDSAMQCIPPHDIFSWLYKLTGTKNCVLTAFYQKVILLSLSAPNGEISFSQYNQIYCVFNMVVKFPDLLTAKPAPVHLMWTFVYLLATNQLQLCSFARVLQLCIWCLIWFFDRDVQHDFLHFGANYTVRSNTITLNW